jgi:hypothetical protein
MSEMKGIEELEKELLKVRLTITEKQKEVEEIQKTNEFLRYA